jgi:hypothetical protein
MIGFIKGSFRDRFNRMMSACHDRVEAKRMPFMEMDARRPDFRLFSNDLGDYYLIIINQEGGASALHICSYMENEQLF